MGGRVVAEGRGWSDVTGKALATTTHGLVSREEGSLALSIRLEIKSCKHGRVLLYLRAQKLCESRGGRPGLPSVISLMVYVDVKQHSTNQSSRDQKL